MTEPDHSIERAATRSREAYYKQRLADPLAADDIAWRAAFLAGLRELREPPGAVVKAGQAALGMHEEEGFATQAAEAWWAMIDALLGEKP